MAKAKFLNTAIKGVCTVVPKGRICLDDERMYYSDEAKLIKLKKTVGLNTRTVAAPDTTPGDMMEVAARKLISEMSIDKTSIDALICVLDFPDYRCPPTACVLHGKLGLPTTCIAFDVTHGCAGYVYGLYLAHSMIDSGAAKRILLLVGDAKSHTINIQDRISAPVFGDGAAATFLERTTVDNEAFFVMGANGSLYENIMIPAGGARMPSSDQTRILQKDEIGNTRSLENFTMNGRAVFDFTMSAVPANIQEALTFSNIQPEDLDYFILHQANKSIILNIALRIGVRDIGKVPVATLSKFGNLAVASIPSVISDQLSAVLQSGKKKLLLSGFGVGLAYGTAIVNTENVFTPSVYTYEEEK